MPRRARIKTFTVPTCRECNQIASGSLFESVTEKLQYIKTVRAKRYRKIIAIPEWTDEEYEEIGDRMRTYIKACCAARDIIKAQVGWDSFEAYQRMAEER